MNVQDCISGSLRGSVKIIPPLDVMGHRITLYSPASILLRAVKSDGSPFTSRKELLEYLSLNIKFNIKTFNNTLFKSKFAEDEHLMKPFK